MNADVLLYHFERISDAPDAVDRLRRFILDLAVRGRLVEQDPGEEGNNGPRSHPTVPFLIPGSWSWAPLRSIGKLSGGMTPSMSREEFWGGEIVWLSPKDIKADEVNTSELRLTQKAIDETSLQLYPPGSLFIVARSGILKRTLPVALNRVTAAANQDMKVLVPFDPSSSRFLQLMLRGMTPFLLRHLVKTGTTVQSLKYSEFEEQDFPLPPLAEQHRIVAKVDELMQLCDRLEASQQERESRRDRLVVASLNRLSQPTDPDEFKKDARFQLSNLNRLSTKPEHIKEIRKAILNLAVRGKLVPPDERDEPFTDQASDGGDLERRLDMQLPAGWRWVQVRDVGESRLGKMLDKAKNRGKPYRYLRNTNVHWFEIRLEEIKTMPLAAEEANTFLLAPGDVLICEGGHGIARTAVWRGDGKEMAFQKALHRVRPGKRLNGDFLSYCIRVYFDEGVLQRLYTGVGIPHFTGVALSKLIFPLPPLAEQKRIVAKVDELMLICDQLENQLELQQKGRRQLLEALLHEALEGVG